MESHPPRLELKPTSLLRRWLERVVPFIGIIILIIAIFIIHNELEDYQYEAIIKALHNTPWSLIFIALALTAFNYLALTGYDFLALFYIDKKLHPAKVMLASSIAFTLSNNVGHTLISGPAVRYRFYKAWGLSGWEIVRLTIFISYMYLLGAMSLAVVAYFFFPQAQLADSPLYRIIQIIIYSALIFIVLYWVVVLFLRKPIRLRDMELTLPTPPVACAQSLIAAIDLVLASLILYVFLNHYAEVPFTTFVVAYVISQVVGLYSQSPGGLGVFEGIFLYTLKDSLATPTILAALILYRIIYFFIPLAIAGSGLLWYELAQRRQLKDKKKATP